MARCKRSSLLKPIKSSESQFDSNQPRPSPKDKGPKDKGPKDKGPKDKGPKEGPKVPEGPGLGRRRGEAARGGPECRPEGAFSADRLAGAAAGQVRFFRPQARGNAQADSSAARELIRKIQNETQQKWADHLFTDQKIKNLAVFWSAAQDRIDAIMEPEQRSHWREMIGARRLPWSCGKAMPGTARTSACRSRGHFSHFTIPRRPAPSRCCKTIKTSRAQVSGTK